MAANKKQQSPNNFAKDKEKKSAAFRKLVGLIPSLNTEERIEAIRLLRDSSSVLSVERKPLLDTKKKYAQLEDYLKLFPQARADRDELEQIMQDAVTGGWDRGIPFCPNRDTYKFPRRGGKPSKNAFYKTLGAFGDKEKILPLSQPTDGFIVSSNSYTKKLSVNETWAQFDYVLLSIKKIETKFKRHIQNKEFDPQKMQNKINGTRGFALARARLWSEQDVTGLAKIHPQIARRYLTEALSVALSAKKFHALEIEAMFENAPASFYTSAGEVTEAFQYLCQRIHLENIDLGKIERYFLSRLIFVPLGLFEKRIFDVGFGFNRTCTKMGRLLQKEATPIRRRIKRTQITF